MSDLLIIGCVASKCDHPRQILDLYNSTLWKRRRAYAKREGRPFGVLSARYGLVRSDDPRRWDPYDLHISDLPDTAPCGAPSKNGMARLLCAYLHGAGRVGFASRFRQEQRGRHRYLTGGTIEVHAGQPYVDLVRHAVASHRQIDNLDVEHPVEGMQIGEQLRWYSQQLGGAVGKQEVLL